MKKNFYFILSLLFFTLACVDENNEPINEQPESCYTSSTSTAKVGETIEFSNCSKNSSHFNWDFGDGNISILREPTHSYLKQGVYEVKLLAGEDRNGDGVFDHLDDPDVFSTEITINPNHLSAKIIIWSTAEWTTESPNYEPANNATVHFYKEYPEAFTLGEPDYTFYSDENGHVKIYDNEIDAVCFVVIKNQESNIVNGFLIGGIFASQEEIDNWAFIENATIGSYKYLDLNGDGIVDDADKAPSESIFITLEETHEKVVYIGK